MALRHSLLKCAHDEHDFMPAMAHAGALRLRIVVQLDAQSARPAPVLV